MLRHQNLAYGPLSFLHGGSDMAQRILRFDWGNHPFGPIEGWPQSLRSALGICLESAFPTAIYWGPELRLLYNDAWAPIPGPRHPGALGAPARDVWADIWHEIEPQFRAVIGTGQGLFLEDKMLPMARYGVPEETYWSYSFTPLRGENGAIAGIFNSGSETTARVLSGRQNDFLLRLSEAMRSPESVEQLCNLTVSSLLTHSGASGALLVEIDEGCRAGKVLAEAWAGEQQPGALNAASLADIVAIVLGDQPSLRIDDIALAHGPPELRPLFEPIDLRSVFAVQRLSSRGRLALCLVSARARNWNAFDCAGCEGTLERLAANLDRILVSERERLIAREIDHRARNALAVAQSIARQTLREGGADNAVADLLDERLATLSRTQALLAREHWQTVDLAALVRDELAPFDATAITIDGPHLPLPPGHAQGLALVIHELITNSVKYGALGNRGSLAISWSRCDPGVIFDWTETHVEKAADAGMRPPSSKFGTRLIERLIRYQLRGELHRLQHETGFHCRITFPYAGTPSTHNETASRCEVAGS